MSNLNNEIWVDLIGYDGIYQISNRGRFKSFKYKREVFIVTNQKLNNTNNRYVKVRVRKNNTQKSIRIHKYVAIHFVPNPFNLDEVNHKDGDRTNNNDWNLEWTTHRENVNHGEITKRSLGKFVGVTPKKDRWRARIYHNKKHVQIGTFDTESEAAIAYQNYCLEHGISLKYVA